MAPRRSTTWRTLTTGVVAITGLASFALWVVVFARVGALHGDRYRLYVLTDDATRVVKGTEVWLEGQKIGLVAAVRLRPVSADTMRRVAIELEVLRAYQPHIRANSRARLRHAGSPIGAPVINVSEGTPAARMLADGDTVLTARQPTSRELVTDLAAASRQIPHLIANVHVIAGEMDRTAHRMSAARASRVPGAVERLERTAERISGFGRLAGSGRQAAHGVPPRGGPGDVTRDATRLKTRLTTLTGAAAGHGTLARLRHDTALGAALSHVGRRLGLLGALLSEPRGSAGRFRRDSAIAQQLRRYRQRDR